MDNKIGTHFSYAQKNVFMMNISFDAAHKACRRRTGEFQFHFTINNGYSINHQAISWQDSFSLLIQNMQSMHSIKSSVNQNEASQKSILSMRPSPEEIKYPQSMCFIFEYPPEKVYCKNPVTKYLVPVLGLGDVPESSENCQCYTHLQWLLL